jgi:hypothetical protein
MAATAMHAAVFLISGSTRMCRRRWLGNALRTAASWPVVVIINSRACGSMPCSRSTVAYSKLDAMLLLGGKHTFGMLARTSGQSRSPRPPAMITNVTSERFITMPA